MPLEDLFSEEAITQTEPREKLLCELYGILYNPFPSAGQTSGHPHHSTEADKLVDAAVKAFYTDRASHIISITASQGVGKTNLLNAYETALTEKLGPRGFFVIRYVADPEPSFDPLIRSIFEYLGEEHLRRTIDALQKVASQQDTNHLDMIRTTDVKNMLTALLKVYGTSSYSFNDRLELSYQWLLGLPVRKAHREELGVQFRLDTVESKTRALRDIVYLSAQLGTLQGVFLLLDELEKHDTSLGKSVVLRYLSALRALIDALPKHLFLMIAITTDALNRYREMLPALKGRLAAEVPLTPLFNQQDAVDLWKFYLDYGKQTAHKAAKDNGWVLGSSTIVKQQEAEEAFRQLLNRSTIKGVRQREFLNRLHEIAETRIDTLVAAQQG